MAESCGIPAPDTTRVVQIEPAPTPTFTASAPALTSASTPSSVTTLPATTGERRPDRLEPLDRLDHPGGVAVGGVDDERVDALGDERVGPLLDIGADPDRRGHPQAAPGVTGGVRELLALQDVLHRDQPDQAAVVVDERQLLDAVLLQEGLGLVQGGADRGRHERRGAS